VVAAAVRGGLTNSGFDEAREATSICGVLDELLLDRAALYVSGSMTETDRQGFEVLLEFNPELAAHVAGLREAVTTALMQKVRPTDLPPRSLRDRILAAAESMPQEQEPDALIVTDGAGRVIWVNEAFEKLCGRPLADMAGRKPGQVLQGPQTDPGTVEKIRAALAARQPCRTELVNYHADGSRYRVDAQIVPVLDDEGRPLWFVARERRLGEV
jgi:PAS domain S-box-containing protein